MGSHAGLAEAKVLSSGVRDVVVGREMVGATVRRLELTEWAGRWWVVDVAQGLQ